MSAAAFGGEIEHVGPRDGLIVVNHMSEKDRAARRTLSLRHGWRRKKYG